eukprot:m.112053 g.112053  ORF g.112053 m.112053 type:complete len:175 (+) comp17026_c0_seq1:154-678(+)
MGSLFKWLNEKAQNVVDAMWGQSGECSDESDFSDDDMDNESSNYSYSSSFPGSSEVNEKEAHSEKNTRAAPDNKNKKKKKKRKKNRIESGAKGGGSKYESEKELSELPSNCVIFVRGHISSMFFDSDGDLAHEFYEATSTGLKRLTDGLVPQGWVDYACPAIAPECRPLLLPNT